MRGLLNERSRRRWAAAEARSAGQGGIAAVVRATDISESTVRRGLEELARAEELEAGRIRRHGAGRPSVLERDPELGKDLDRLIDPVTRGDPESLLRWRSKSGAKLAAALQGMGHQVVDRTVLRLLKAKGYSLQANEKTREGAQHPDRDAQFEHINQTVAAAIAAGQPAISIDSKKRELVGDFKAVGREFEPKGKPVEVRTHDFKDKQLGHAIPFGVYDLAERRGVGQRRDRLRTLPSSRSTRSSTGGSTSAGRATRHATTLTITADCGGANSNRVRLWKTECQRLADQHRPCRSRSATSRPGTSKWNKVEHRLFSFMSLNWRGKPLDQPRGHHQPDRRHHHQHRPEGLRPTRQAPLPNQDRSHRPTTRRRQHHPQHVPRRLELHHQPLSN